LTRPPPDQDAAPSLASPLRIGRRFILLLLNDRQSI
jgi:hypothetical protein